MKKVLALLFLSTFSYAGTVVFNTGGSGTYAVNGGGNGVLTIGTPSSGGGGGGFGPFAHQQAITISSTNVSNVLGVISNFPVLISTNDISISTTSGAGGHLLNASGFDLVFTTHSDCSSPYLNFDTETLQNVGVSTFNAWVRIPTLSTATAISASFYMCYGNAAITTYQGVSTNAWNSNFVGVWHFPNGTTLSANDSTSLNNSGTIHTASAVTGKVDGAAFITNSNSAITVPTSSSFNNAAISVSGWVNSSDNSTDQIMTRDDGTNRQFQFRMNNGNLQFIIFNSGGAQVCTSGGTIDTGVWTYVYGTYDGTTVRCYINGSPDGTASTTGPLNSATVELGLGTREVADPGSNWQGSLDELRLMSTAVNSDWITTDTNNQLFPTTFATIGAEQ